MEHPFTNNLINSTSPYLLQHAHNPVNWQAWSNEVIEEAKKENKLLLISIGYAACHWCHVMENESFEDVEVAKIMNKNFFCIKVDREERPDVDHYYMTSVQLMQQRGGWPLNIIALPDGRPIWGGTYFPKGNWTKSILTVADFYKEKRKETEDYAKSLQNGIQQISLTVENETVVPANTQLLNRGVEVWKKRFDMELGGNAGAPKFPMPVNLDFLLNYGILKNDKTTLDFVETTLLKMARGGIYDQVGGGFARYSVDEKWKVPHFEKMLYDNGQLLSIYSKGFHYYKNEEFKSVIYETIDFLEHELMDKTNAFYSSLDADSEGVEGKFYVWNDIELKEIIGEDFGLFSDYFNINSRGFWENGNYILLRELSAQEFAAKNNLSNEQFNQKLGKWKKLLLEKRKKRIRPGLDDKTLTSWNALVIQGLTDAYKAFNDKRFLNIALKNASFLRENVMNSSGKLFHNWKNGKASVDGFLEDYSILIQAYISLFEVTGDVLWLDLAEKMTNYVFDHFYDETIGLFYFSAKNENAIITNHYQKEDNVLPSSNSVMANNLHRLYFILGRPEYLVVAKKMLQHITPNFVKYPMAYANWGTLMLKTTESFFEVAVCGENAQEILMEMQIDFQPQIIWVYSDKPSEVPILKDRFIKNKTLIYVCEEGICQMPVESAEEANVLLKYGK